MTGNGGDGMTGGDEEMGGEGRLVPAPTIKAEVVHPRRSWRDMVWETTLLLPNLVKLIGRLLRDRRVPVKRKVVVGVVMAYLVSPIDVVPDVIPVLGQADDALLIAFAIRLLTESVGREVVMEYWDGSEDAFDLLDALLEWGADLVPAPVRRLLG